MHKEKQTKITKRGTTSIFFNKQWQLGNNNSKSLLVKLSKT